MVSATKKNSFRKARVALGFLDTTPISLRQDLFFYLEPPPDLGSGLSLSSLSLRTRLDLLFSTHKRLKCAIYFCGYDKWSSVEQKLMSDAVVWAADIFGRAEICVGVVKYRTISSSELGELGHQTISSSWELSKTIIDLSAALPPDSFCHVYVYRTWISGGGPFGKTVFHIACLGGGIAIKLTAGTTLRTPRALGRTLAHEFAHFLGQTPINLIPNIPIFASEHSSNATNLMLPSTLVAQGVTAESLTASQVDDIKDVWCSYMENE